MKGSGWRFEFLQSFILHVFKYNPLQIKSYLPLPKEIQNKKCCINIQNEDNKCFEYCILYHVNKNDQHLKQNPERQSKYKKNIKKQKFINFLKH